MSNQQHIVTFQGIKQFVKCLEYTLNKKDENYTKLSKIHIQS